MHTKAAISDSDLVRQHALENYVAGARRRGERRLSINVGTVHRALGLRNRVPLVCAALSSKKFLSKNHLLLVSQTGPSSGQSTTVTFTYEFAQDNEKLGGGLEAFLALRGIGKELFASLGGGEAFLRRERSEFSRAIDTRESESVPRKR
jgi:hypothetical protein